MSLYVVSLSQWVSMCSYVSIWSLYLVSMGLGVPLCVTLCLYGVSMAFYGVSMSLFGSLLVPIGPYESL